MTSAQDYSVIVGALLPPVLAVVLQKHWSETAKSWVAFVCCIVAALVTTYFAGTLTFARSDAQSVGTNIALVLASALALYQSFWKPTGIAPAIQSATTLPRIGIIKDTPATPPPAA